MARGLRAAGFALLAAHCAGAAAQVELSIASIERGALQLRDLRLRGALRDGAPARLSIGELQIGAQRIGPLRIDCARLRLVQGRMRCPAANFELARGERHPGAFEFHPESGRLDLSIAPRAGERWQLRLNPRGGGSVAELSLQAADAARLGRWWPALAAYRPAGRIDGRIVWSAQAELHATLTLAGGAFADDSGLHAAEKLQVRVQLDAAAAPRPAPGTRWSARFDWDGGGVFWSPWYWADKPLRLEARGDIDWPRLAIRQGRLEAGAQQVRFSADADVSARALGDAEIELLQGDAGQLFELLAAPLLQQAGAPAFTAAGRVRGRLEIRAGEPVSAELAAEALTLAETGGRYALEGVQLRLPWSAAAAVPAALRFERLRYGRLATGAVAIDALIRPAGVSVAQAAIPLLDSRILVGGLNIERAASGWTTRFGLAVEPLSLARLTEALEWPRMSGTLSASIPAIVQEPGAVRLEGALVVQVFDGFLSATELRLIEPFGRTPRLLADLEMRHVDLGQLTDTFSFGRVTGLIDGEVKNLELTGWRPTRFDAWVASSPGDYRRRISQRAVQNISALGGGGAAAAVQRSFLRFFEEFGYSRFGLSCVLRDGVCRMGGIAPDAGTGPYTIVSGGGVPALTVVGYNRSVDWEELLERLARVTAGRPTVQ